MDAMDREGEQKFVNPISESEDDAQKTSAREFESAEDAVDPTQGEYREEKKTAMRVPKEMKPVEEDLLNELDITVEDVNMDPYSLFCNCWENWSAMTCGERVDAVKTVSTSLACMSCAPAALILVWWFGAVSARISSCFFLLATSRRG